jgi:hypothetical protein
MMRYLVHVVGDIHQPLHTTEMYNLERFPKGDIAGNSFKVLFDSPNNIDNLHKLFDSALERIRNNFERV